MNIWQRRKVVNYHFVRLPHCPRNGGRYILQLECGHETSQKASVRIPSKTACMRCPTRQI